MTEKERTTGDQQGAIDRIRAVVAPRSRELGGRNIGAADLRITVDQVPTAPGCTLFTAGWGTGCHAGTLVGLLCGDKDPDTYPGRALATLLDRWNESSPPPAAATVAAAAARLFDPDRRRVPVLDGHGPGGTAAPELLGSDRLAGVSLWWIDEDVPRHLTLVRDGGDGVRVTEETQPRKEGTP
ncbi:hypothetical protein AAGW05_01960 [Arthrobacter sp. LAPM80]|uniref:hypothetical protein n=1 Tax=Arthrobacter sp. LAPM80 TaxID=3141788 RepID=UPI00398AE1DE